MIRGRQEAPVRHGEPPLLRRAPWIAAFVAGLASLPGLRLPFLSDDWAQVAAVADGTIARTPFGYFRPLYMATLWLDWFVAGASPSFFHLTNAAWIAAAAGLVAVAVRRYTGDARLALASGMLFALHPFHVENAAWIAARGDAVVAVPCLLAALSYDRWRAAGPGLPWAALGWFEAALLAKESAVSLPPLLLLVGLVDPGRRPGRREWTRGFPAFALLAVLHFLVLRPRALGGTGRTMPQSAGRAWMENGLGMAAAAVLPLDVEILAGRPVLYGLLAFAAASGLVAIARLASGRVPRVALAAAAGFGVLAAPYVVGFQERYLFLPSAASAVFLGSLVLAARRRVAVLLSALLATGWAWGSAAQWRDWNEAAVASRALVRDLAEAARDGATREIVVANMPFRVRGSSVAGDFAAALRLAGERPLPVRAMALVSHPRATADGLDGPADTAIRRPPPEADVRLRVREGPFSHLVWPRPGAAGVTRLPEGRVGIEENGRVRITVVPDAASGRAAYAWAGGRLVRLFGPGDDAGRAP